MRGMALVNAASLIAEPGRSLAFCQSTPADGLSRAGGRPNTRAVAASNAAAITKAGNAAARRLLIEAAWS